jgi:hypothetical protein
MMFLLALISLRIARSSSVKMSIFFDVRDESIAYFTIAITMNDTIRMNNKSMNMPTVFTPLIMQQIPPSFWQVP